MNENFHSSSPSALTSETETQSRMSFDVFPSSSRESFKNANETEKKTYQFLLYDFFKHEKIPERNVLLPLFSPVSSPLKPSKAPSQVFSSEETEASPYYQGRSLPDCLSESDWWSADEREEWEAEEPERNQKKVSIHKSSIDSRTVQNKMKNHQGTIAGKIKKLCKQDGKTEKNTRLFDEATKYLTPDKTKRFRKWAMKFQKTYRTWNKLQEFMSTNPEFGIIFADMAILLLSEDFKTEFEECINKGRMGEKAKALLREQSSKEFYKGKFHAIIDELEGNVVDFGNEIKKHRKSLKTN